MITPQIRVLPDLAGIAYAAAERIVQSSRAAIVRSGEYSIALSGGSTPQALYSLLAGDDFFHQIEWAKVQFYFGDERCVPPDSDQSNYRMAKESLFDHAPIPAANIHRIRGEIPPEAAADEYDQLLAERCPNGMDLTLLGMGPDGHTASLFPHSAALDEKQRLCVANWVETLQTWRVTMTVPYLNRSREALILASGAEKKERLQEVLEGPRDPKRLPIQFIAPDSGRLVWLMDIAAAAMDE
jgi:6-phosphogluconolactonase